MLCPLISIAGQKVVAHGTLVSYAHQPIDFYPLPPPNDGYRIEIIWKVEPDKPSTATLSVVGPLHVTVTYVNFDNMLGAANASPVYVANFENTKLLLSIASVLIGPSDTGTRVVSYTFLSGGAIDG
jgi:hypothetical protein